jgi:predicted nucleic acid-binding protein
MAEFILDASVAISWCFPGDPTEDTPYSRSILQKLITQDAIVPEIWAFEIANNIFVSHNKRKRINAQQVSEYLGLLKSLPIRVETQQLWSNVELESQARRWNIAAYDAAYLALAKRKNLPLATSDELLKLKALDEGIEILG